MSHGLAPSKSTVYVSNLPFSLTNNDLHKIFVKYGKVVKVTVVKDKQTRKSKGVAFILFLNKDDAKKCVSAVNGQQMFGRTLKCSIATDNGRSAEFIRRRNYPDKSRCYECGEDGHLSYSCPYNALGERQPPPKKERKRKRKSDTKQPKENLYDDDDDDWQNDGGKSESEEEEEEPDLETLSAAIRMEQEQAEIEKYRQKVAAGDYKSDVSQDSQIKRKRIKRNAYFSDEEDISD